MCSDIKSSWKQPQNSICWCWIGKCECLHFTGTTVSYNAPARDFINFLFLPRLLIASSSNWCFIAALSNIDKCKICQLYEVHYPPITFTFFFQINHKRQLYVCQQNNHTIGHHWIEQWPKKSFAKVRSSLLTGTDRCVYAVADRQQTFWPVHSSFHQITFSQTFTWFWIKTFHANLTCMNFQGIDLFCEWEGCDKW